ncbi:MAG: MBOAT family protein [Myxococcales bacterium]|nr:MBOAT family protein [Polyangiaceae bacterium]MDW8248544.1 MBOAT family protein [Myxococcales bacterium]
MLFNTLAYARFFAVVFLASWLLSRFRVARLVLLLVASYVFYAGWKWQYLPLIFASSTLDFLLALKIDGLDDPIRRRRWLVLTVVVNLGMLGFFKYWNFTLETTESLLRFVRGGAGPDLRGWKLDFALPVGISFFTFESMSYVIDVYRRDLPVCRSYLRYLLFVAFFPHLVAGPIVRLGQLLPQFDKEPRLDPREGSEGLFLVAVGLLKKVVIGDYLAINLVDRVFDRTTSFSALETLAGIYGYALQIYCDFSGYTDVAIGSALLLGIRINENFRSPYQATNLQEFWQRWHISLSTWLRDYLYIPLGGNRGKPWHTYRNMMITMLLGGLWHGASWTFVFWGFLHGAAQAVGRAWQRARGVKTGADEPLGKRIAWGLVTFHFVCFAWVFFRAPTFGKALAVLKQIGTLTTFHPNLPPKLLGIMALGFVTHLLPHNLYDWIKARFVDLPAPAQALCLLIAAYVLREATSSAVVPFIYFQF